MRPKSKRTKYLIIILYSSFPHSEYTCTAIIYPVNADHSLPIYLLFVSIEASDPFLPG
jgi:hypothetical protein